MALFSRKEAKKEATSEVVAQHSISAGVSHVLRNPRITEKASVHQSIGVYTFDVDVSATKRMIMQAIAAAYKVHPVKVRIVSIPAKIRRSARSGRMGVKSGGKKAYVYLKKGDQITLA